MSPESSTENYPAFARIELRKNPGKNLNQTFTISIVFGIADWRRLRSATNGGASLAEQHNSPTAALLYKYSKPHRELNPSYDDDDDDDDDGGGGVCALEVPCVPSLNMNDAFRTKGYHIEEHLLSTGLDERLGMPKERGNEALIDRILDAA
ncbi:hypothetical protein ANN_17258 [Periplaneta americana]|uniref:Uncharacterized protein n=1 Tax=Periplaneta americana TaxID=6978 RepID=A0ABQ8ST14_PERAM|nr:hypothetical protein ANN_17258 [Periplaneta americana]